MFTLLFISGKNWQLSLAELTAYMQARQINFEIQQVTREFFVIQIQQTIDLNVIDELGGIIKIGKVALALSSQQVKDAYVKHDKQVEKQVTEALEKSEIVTQIAKQTGKAFFGVSVYIEEDQIKPRAGEMQRLLGSAIKSELSKQGKKARFMGFADKSQGQLSHVEVLKKGLVENKSEILLCIDRETSWLATTMAVHNPFEFQKRDIYKPRQRKIFGMPPRLAKIMVNLSSCTENKTLLDAFCGVGTVLQEALLIKANVVGTDINSWCIKAAEDNLKWLAHEYELQQVDYRIIQSDVSVLSKKIGIENIDCIASEPDLGPALRQIPTTPYAKKIIDKLTPLFFEFIEEAYKVLKPDGKLVVVTPYIVTRTKQIVTMPIGEKAEAINFTRVKPFSSEIFSKNIINAEALTNLETLVEVDYRHLIGREIHVFRK
ncbi:MAG: methyltransferase domain-containing protein [Candidatus Bathyarchaeota archaeon]|uniref:DNA methyltransferase n=1 Tax=Candidatus Bathycorpusculum sp. TaxID=2994959 RepID=UPI002821D6B4|nr:methyltransferase domain-containing protein [Candidatus Termiticorpusculum sp.]MCL2256688.1 methyltransferase domain-containing protein [Candidatus Termiticorpusculum sp.]MCL2293120.1 methyltransferase domain-containing protein [Candidatus Termiticorpusculum sp.]